MSRRLAWAPAVVAAYVLLAAASARLGLPHRPIFDGQAPALPYRWVAPPPDLAAGNRPPLPGSGTIPFEGTESAPQSVQTEDGQAQVSFSTGAFPATQGAEGVRVEIRAMNPGDLGPPPTGLRYDSNAYALEATYEPSGEPAELVSNVTVVLRYARHGTDMLRWTGTRWEPLLTDAVPASLTVFASTDRLGTFALGGPPFQPFPWGTIAVLSGGAALLAAVLGYRARRKLARRDGRGR